MNIVLSQFYSFVVTRIVHDWGAESLEFQASKDFFLDHFQLIFHSFFFTFLQTAGGQLNQPLISRHEAGLDQSSPI